MNTNSLKKLKDHKGLKRLTVFLLVIVFIASFISWVAILGNELRNDFIKAISIFVFCSGLSTLLFYIILRTIYWIIDGFRIENQRR